MTCQGTKKLHIAVFLDGRAGHEKQSRGILAALAEYTDLDVQEIVVPRPSPLSYLQQIFSFFWPNKGTLHKKIASAELLLGTGSKTHLPMLATKKRYSIPAIICMSPASFLLRFFDLCFVPEHDGIESPNVIKTMGAPNCAKNMGKHQVDRGLILIGGLDKHSHNWSSSDVTDKIREILVRQPHLNWTISSSPRTPLQTIKNVRQIEQEFRNAAFYHYKDTPPGWIEEQYNENGIVWVTADSISMVYEAITAGCKVGIIPMHWKKNGKFKRNEDLLIKRGYVLSYPMWLQQKSTWQNNLQLNESKRCAQAIIERWGKKN